jgi:CRISPR-associated endonuclease/helicase Cas3
MSNPRTLLGKSKTNGRDRSLPEHTRDVLRAVDALFRTKDRPSRLGLAWIRFFGIAEAEFDRFMRHLRIAAAFHDLGKANDGFQEMLVREGSQVLRHEHLSALLMAEASVTNWLREAHLDVDILLAAVVSHHLQAGTTGTNAVAQISGVRSVIRLYPDHEDFLAVRALIEETVGCTWPDNVVLPSIMKEHGITRRGEAVRTAMLKQKSRLRNDPDRRKLLQALRAGLIVADSVGSAITRLPDRMEPWIRDSFPDLLTTD